MVLNNGMGGQGLPNLGQPGISMTDQIRVQKQIELVQKTWCVNGCPNGAEVSANIPKTFDHGAPRNALVRCIRCLTSYEITPNAEIVNIQHVLQAPGLPPKALQAAESK